MAHRAARQLLRELSTPARSALRLPPRNAILAPRRTASTYGREPTPMPQTPSQQMAERALLQKLSTLTPDQISALLSAPSDAPIPPHSPKGASSPPSPRNKWFLRLAFALTSMLLGFELGETIIDSSELLTWAARGVDFPEGDKPFDPRDRTRFLFEYLNEIPRMEFLMRRRSVFFIIENGLLFAATPETSHEIRRDIAASNPTALDPKARTVIETDAGTAIFVDSGPPHENAKALAIPAFYALLFARHPELQAACRSHLVAGSLNTPNTMGLLNHTLIDPLTGDDSSVVSFGRGMCGWPGVVHGGALATAALDSAQRHASTFFTPQFTFRPTKITITYHSSLPPCVPVFIQPHDIGGDVAIRQEFVARKRAQGKQALAEALKPIDHPSLTLPREEYEELIQEANRKRIEREALTTVVRMWTESNAVAQPICEAKVTFLRASPEEEEEYGLNKLQELITAERAAEYAEYAAEFAAAGTKPPSDTN